MSHATFRTAYDCLPRQIPLALKPRGRVGAVPVLHDRQPAIGNTPLRVLPVTDAVDGQAEGFGEVGNAAFDSNCFLKNVHTHDFITVVSDADTQSHCHTAGMTKVSQRLKEARAKKGWNQAQLAVAADVSPGTIGNIESGARQAKGSLPQIAKAMGISHDWLANGVGAMIPADEEVPPPAGPSTQAALLALLFDKLADDVVLRAQVFNRASEIIISTIQGTDFPPSQAQAAQSPAKKQSV